jgi:hypothetical protein
MTDSSCGMIDPEAIAKQLIPSARATAYPPLPIDPFDGRAQVMPIASQPDPKPTPAPAPGGPSYPSLPLEPDTRGGKPGQQK